VRAVEMSRLSRVSHRVDDPTRHSRGASHIPLPNATRLFYLFRSLENPPSLFSDGPLKTQYKSLLLASLSCHLQVSTLPKVAILQDETRTIIPRPHNSRPALRPGRRRASSGSNDPFRWFYARGPCELQRRLPPEAHSVSRGSQRRLADGFAVLLVCSSGGTGRVSDSSGNGGSAGYNGERRKSRCCLD